jgi:3-oxoacyl-[acyl-carrier protein] reductase
MVELLINLKLKRKRVFISGSSKGIGFSIAEKFVEEGAEVVINGRNIDNLKAASSLLGKCKIVGGDVTNPQEAQKIIIEAAQLLGGIDIIICNVGSGSSVPPGNETYKEWNRILSLNFFSAVNLVSSSMNFLEESKGSIVCISSICGNETIPGVPVTYSVAKSALNTYVKSISLPLAKKAIRINSVAPGNIIFKGSIWEEKLEKNPELVEEMLKHNVPLNKFGTPDDISNLVIFLASDISNFITGSIFTSDGGQTRSK